MASPLLETATAGASPPSETAFVSGSVGVGTGTSLQGTAFFDTGVADSTPVVNVTYQVVPTQTFCPPPMFNPCAPVWTGSATPTYFGWFAEWNTVGVANGNYYLNIFAQDAASNTTYTLASHIAISVANPPPTTSMLIPGSGATV
jgi:hypothetical protein